MSEAHNESFYLYAELSFVQYKHKENHNVRIYSMTLMQINIFKLNYHIGLKYNINNYHLDVHIDTFWSQKYAMEPACIWWLFLINLLRINWSIFRWAYSHFTVYESKRIGHLVSEDEIETNYKKTKLHMIHKSCMVHYNHILKLHFTEKSN